MTVPTYGKKERLQHTLLMMRAGHLFDLPPSARREILDELCEPGELDDRLRESQLPVTSFAGFGPATMRAFQQGLKQSGRELGETLRSGGHFAENKWELHNRDTKSAISAQLYPFVTRRIGEFEKGKWKAGWHIFNTALFLLILIVLGLASGSDSGDIAAELLISLWMISVGAMGVVLLSNKRRRNDLERRNSFNELYAELEKPLLEGIYEELLRAGEHRKMENLVTKQSWPGRGMPLDRQPDQMQSTDHWAPGGATGKKTSSGRSATARRLVSQSTTATRAEEMCATWMLSNVESSARVTRPGADGGVDVRSRSYVAQVKNYKGYVGVQPVREIYGIAAAEQKSALFFTSGSYTHAAVDFADSVGMPLIVYDAALGKFYGANRAGERFV